MFVDDNHGVGNAVQNRREMRRALLGIGGTRRRADAGPAQQLAAPGHADADHGENSASHPVRGNQRAEVPDQKQRKEHAKRGGNEPRTPTANCGGDQDRRDEEKVRSLAVQHVGERQFGGKTRRNGKNRDAVVPGRAAPSRRR